MDNLLPKYYQKDNERLQEKTREKYQHLFEVKKEKKNNMVANDMVMFFPEHEKQ